LREKREKESRDQLEYEKQLA